MTTPTWCREKIVVYYYDYYYKKSNIETGTNTWIETMKVTQNEATMQLADYELMGRQIE